MTYSTRLGKAGLHWRWWKYSSLFIAMLYLHLKEKKHQQKFRKKKRNRKKHSFTTTKKNYTLSCFHVVTMFSLLPNHVSNIMLMWMLQSNGRAAGVTIKNPDEVITLTNCNTMTTTVYRYAPYPVSRPENWGHKEACNRVGFIISLKAR